MINNYYIKYLKYKEKYINLKKQNGGNSKILNDGIIQFIHRPPFDKKLQFNDKIIFIQNDKKIIKYEIINFLGSGTYGEVYKIISSDGKEFVIKIGFKDDEADKADLLDEVKILERLMIDVLPQCNYKSILSGIQKINTLTVYHIIFPFKGNNNMKVVLTNPDNIHLIPSLLNDIITCLKEINKKGFHGDLKLDNIVVNDRNNAFIIDYGLGKIYDEFDFSDIRFLSDSNTKFRLGNQQKSIDNIISYKLIKKDDENKLIKLNELYNEHKGKILGTIDNFGLFWLIMNCFEINLQEYIKEPSFVNITSDDRLHNLYIKLYFDLNPPKTDFEFKIVDLFEIEIDSIDKKFRESFIEEVYGYLHTHTVFNRIFKNDDNFYKFMNRILNLITIDPARRMSIQELSLEEFFT